MWRTVDQHGNDLDILIQSKPDSRVANRFFRTLLKHQGHPPQILATDKLASCRFAPRATMSMVEYRQNKYSNNRCENSHQPTRQRERAMKAFCSVFAAQGFLADFSRISPHFRPHVCHRSPRRHDHPIPGVGSGCRTRRRRLTDRSVRWSDVPENCCTPNNLTVTDETVVTEV